MSSGKSNFSFSSSDNKRQKRHSFNRQNDPLIRGNRQDDDFEYISPSNSPHQQRPQTPTRSSTTNCPRSFSPRQTNERNGPHAISASASIKVIGRLGSTSKNSAPSKAPDSSKNNRKTTENHGENGFFSEFDKNFDDFVATLSEQPLVDKALELFFRKCFKAKLAIVWQEIRSLQILYSTAFNLTNLHSEGLVGNTFFQRSVIRVENGREHPAFNENIDQKFFSSNEPALLFPLWDYRGNICYIVEVIRLPDAKRFSELDQQFVEWFSRKFKMLSNWLLTFSCPRENKNIDKFAMDIFQLVREEHFLQTTRSKIAQFFDCDSVDIWKYDQKRKYITRFSDKVEQFDESTAGIVGDSIVRNQITNVISTQRHNSFCPTVDNPNEAVLSLPISPPVDSPQYDSQIKYAVVLHGPHKRALFTEDDEILLTKLAPLILLALFNSETFSLMDSEFQSSQIERKGLTALLEVVEVISSQLDSQKLTEVIMEKGRILTNADRCSLFVVNETRDRLITSLHQGLENCIDIPINKGIAGKTVMEGKALNISDAYQYDFFDPSTDLESGYRTNSILSVPIYNDRGIIIGVTEMVNKLDGKSFTQWDMKLLQIFNIFCGISIENSKLYQDTIDLSNELKTFFNAAFSIINSKSLQRVLSEIFQSAKKSIGANNIGLLIVDEAANVLSTFLTDHENFPTSIPIGSGLVGQCIREKKSIIANDCQNDPNFNRNIDNVIHTVTKNLLISPILARDETVLGVSVMGNKKEGLFNTKNEKTLQAFSTFASIALENSKLKDIAELGDAEIEMKKWIGESERSSTEVPKRLVLSESEKYNVRTINCFAVDFKGIGHIKELFYFFNLFNLLDAFKITNDAFFRFIFTISSTYNPVPYHNWTHACDVTQYVAYQILTANLTNIFNINEIFGIMIAAICHDANHEGLTNVYNVKAETPFGILFKDQSVMEMHHITVAIPIITRDDVNLFKSLNSEETKKMWNLFIKLILATDMARHFELVKEAQTLLDEEKWSIDVPENRILALQLILKVADISNVSRPFDLANKWCDILNQEFFRQGDLEKSNGIGLTSPLNDRENSDKPKSQIGFYCFICLPLYQVLARIFPELQVNVDYVKSNLEVWKTMTTSA